jgi:signal recognition particle receptor subunit beta
MLDEDGLRGATLIVYANKADLPGALNTVEMIQALELHHVENRKWFIQSTCAITGDGLYEGLDWLACNLSKTK